MQYITDKINFIEDTPIVIGDPRFIIKNSDDWQSCFDKQNYHFEFLKDKVKYPNATTSYDPTAEPPLPMMVGQVFAVPHNKADNLKKLADELEDANSDLNEKLESQAIIKDNIDLSSMINNLLTPYLSLLSNYAKIGSFTMWSGLLGVYTLADVLHYRSDFMDDYINNPMDCTILNFRGTIEVYKSYKLKYILGQGSTDFIAMIQPNQ